MGTQRIAESSVLDARPLRPVSTETPWDEARTTRDRLLEVVRRTLAAEGVEALVMRSQAGNYPAWLRLEAWLPTEAGGNGVREKTELEVIVEAKPLRLHPVTFAVRAQRGKQALVIAGRRRLSDEDFEQWVRFAIGRGPRPGSYTPVLDNLRRSVAWIVPAAAPEHNPTAPAFRASLLDMPTIAAVVICAVLALGLWQPALTGFVAPLIGFVALLAGFAALFVFPRIEQRDWVAAEPSEGPRHLGHIDSWHAVLAGVAGGEAKLKRRLMERLAAGAEAGFAHKLERYGHRTPNGFEERERLTITHGQGEVHLHIQPYGEDLFVGWQAFLNWSQWAETPPQARKAIGRRDIAFRELTPAWYLPTQFDLIDLDSLSALVQRAVEAEVRAILAELKLEQEIDFEVIRADRSDAIDQRSVWPERSTHRQRNSWRFLGASPVRQASVGEMKLAPVQGTAADREGLAAWPAVLLLPAVTALAYWGIANSGQMASFQFRRTLAPDFTFTFLPMFHLPIALAVGIGVFVYAKARLLQALLAVLLVVALTFGLTYAYNLGLAQLIRQRDLQADGVLYPVLFGSFALSGLAGLMGASAFAPQLREPRVWLRSILLWALWGVATLWIVRTQRLTGDTGNAVIWSTRVLMAATIGWALTREAGGSILARLRERRASAVHKDADRPAVSVKTFSDGSAAMHISISWQLIGALAVMLAIAAALLMAGDALGRYLFNVPLSWASDFSTLLVLWGFALGLPIAVLSGAAVRPMLGQPDRGEAMSPGRHSAVQLIIAGILALLAGWSFQDVVSSYVTFERSVLPSEMPLWWSRSALPVGFGLAFVASLVKLASEKRSGQS